MAEKKITYTLDIDTEISGLLSELKKAKNAMEGLGDGSFKKGTEKKIESIENAIARLRKKAA
jgi:hypothetical protein